MGRPKNLTVAEKFYIEQKLCFLSQAQMAKDLKVTVKAIEKYVKTLPAPTKQEPPHVEVKSGLPKIAGFDVSGPKEAPVVSMTPGQSMADDDLPKGDNKAFFDRYKGCVSKIRPNE